MSIRNNLLTYSKHTFSVSERIIYLFIYKRSLEVKRYEIYINIYTYFALHGYLIRWFQFKVAHVYSEAQEKRIRKKCDHKARGGGGGLGP